MATTTDKIDLYKLNKHDYATPKSPTLLRVKPAQYLAIDGVGAPGADDFVCAVGALYGLAYTLKFASKARARDFVVCKLEGFYDGDDVGTGGPPPEDLAWTLAIRVPDFIKPKDLTDARRSLEEKGKDGAFERARLETIDEGECVQVLHVGPYCDEGTTIAAMLAHAAEQHRTPRGRHHEVYLSDPRRVPEEKLRTILRQPVTAAP